jgi:hypothetical protein
MGYEVVRCSVCGHVHKVTELLNLKHLPNGAATFSCPEKKGEGSYRIENVGTVNPNIKKG